MEYRLPYYMTYPMPLAYDDEKIDRRDFEYMKSMYPDLAKKILPHVEAECDRMEYQNSMMYDEYPDKLQLRMMCSRVYDKVKKNEWMLDEDGEAEGLRDLLEVLVYEELMRRRRDSRRRYQKFY